MRKILILILILLLISPVSSSLVQRVEISGFFKKIKNFLESQWVEEVKLLRASTISRPDSKRIYIASDNLWASYALSLLSSPLGEKIKKELEKYNNGFDELHEVILGIRIPDIFYTRKNEFINVIFSKKFGVIEIFYEKPNKSQIIIDWYNYADLLAYKALNYLLEGKINEAVQIYEKLMKMWDGWGFKDIIAVNSKSYGTYKVALGLFLSKKLERVNRQITDEYKEDIGKMKSIILSLQDENGGIVTDYIVQEGKIIPIGDSNTETTSMVAIAFLG